MSITAIAWAWEQKGLKPPEKIVLLSLCDNLNQDTGLCCPSYEDIGERAGGISVSSVQRHLDTLVSLGLIEKTDRLRRDNGTLGTWRYKILTDAKPLQTTTGQSDHRSQVTGQNQKRVCDRPSSAVSDDLLDAVVVGRAGAENLADEPPQLALVVGGEPTPPRTVRHPVTVALKGKKGRKVTEAEHVLCDEILAAFNEIAGTTYTKVEWREKVIRRIHEHPDMTAEQHRVVIERAFQNPWWSGTPSPAVIYGNGGQFERSMQTAVTVKKTARDEQWDMLARMHAEAKAEEAAAG